MPRGLNSASSAADQLPQCLLNLNWKQPLAHDADFESALSSLVSSPSSHPAAAAAAADGAVIGELIGRLGSICNSREISPSSRHRSANTSCYSTPLNSPPKLNLSMVDHRRQGRGGLPVQATPIPGSHFVPFSADPWFAEGAGRLSHCGGMSSPGFAGQFGLPETPGNLSRVSSSKSLIAGAGSRTGAPANGSEVGLLGRAQLEMQMRSKFGASSTPEDLELDNGEEKSSVSDRVTADASSLRGISESNARKRKAAAKGKAKEAPLSYSATTNPPNMTEEEISDAKRCKPVETNDVGKDAEVKTRGEKNNDTKPPEPPKDYIHVRARRGQATDAHSLAERVRREKISKRMKFLQDLVPGCNKVTGKAVMLDEIINYVQSLQRQVEFLSMKLATLNPQLDSMETLLRKDVYQARGPMPQLVYPAEMTSTALSYARQPQPTPHQSIVTSGLESQFLNPLESSLQQSQPPPLNGFTDATSQLGHFWEDDLQSVAQIGFGHNQESAFSSQSFDGQVHASHTKIEL